MLTKPTTLQNHSITSEVFGSLNHPSVVRIDINKNFDKQVFELGENKKNLTCYDEEGIVPVKCSTFN